MASEKLVHLMRWAEEKVEDEEDRVDKYGLKSVEDDFYRYDMLRSEGRKDAFLEVLSKITSLEAEG